MTIRIRNQRPASLYSNPYDLLPSINPTKTSDEYNQEITDHIKNNYIAPMFDPIVAGTPVTIEDTDASGNTQTITEDMVYDGMRNLWADPTLDVKLQDQLNEIYRQGIKHHSTNDWYFEEQLGIEAITRMKLPVPVNLGGRIVRYSASVDVIPSAKNFLGHSDDQSATNWFANICAYAHARPFSNYLLMTVQTGEAFNEIKQQLKNFIQMWQTQHTIDTDTIKLLNDFDKIDLMNDLSAGLFLPNGGGTSNLEQEALSFTRIIMYALSIYEKDINNKGNLTIQPSNLHQLYMPENIIIINLENYAHAKPKAVRKDWDDFEKAMNTKKTLNIVSNKRLMTAQVVNRGLSMANRTNSTSNAGADVRRGAIKPFSGKPIPAKAMLSMMRRIIQSQITKQVTQNTYKSHKRTFMRPNRRNPDDFNLPGKLTTTLYRPDIHVYIDTSGSISESQYRDSVTNLIMLSKQIDCNLYISSFSHYISETALLITKNRTATDIYKQFLTIPQVSGGTDFENVWRKIELIDQANTYANKSHQINFIITDFGYSLSSGHRWNKDQASVKNTYYVPVSIGEYGWANLMNWARDLSEQMVKAGDTDIRKRMLL